MSQNSCFYVLQVNNGGTSLCVIPFDEQLKDYENKPITSQL